MLPEYVEEDHLFWMQFNYYASLFFRCIGDAYVWEWRGGGKTACDDVMTGVAQIVVKWGV